MVSVAISPWTKQVRHETTQLHPVPNLGKSRAIPPLCHVPSQCGQKNFAITSTDLLQHIISAPSRYVRILPKPHLPSGIALSCIGDGFLNPLLCRPLKVNSDNSIPLNSTSSSITTSTVLGLSPKTWAVCRRILGRLQNNVHRSRVTDDVTGVSSDTIRAA